MSYEMKGYGRIVDMSKYLKYIRKLPRCLIKAYIIRGFMFSFLSTTGYKTINYPTK